MFLPLVSALAALFAFLSIPPEPTCASASPRPSCPPGRDGQSTPGSLGSPGPNCYVTQFPNGYTGCYYEEDGTVTEENPHVATWTQELLGAENRFLHRIQAMIALTICVLTFVRFNKVSKWVMIPILFLLIAYLLY